MGARGPAAAVVRPVAGVCLYEYDETMGRVA